MKACEKAAPANARRRLYRSALMMSSSGFSARCSLPDFLIVSRSIEEIDRWKRQIESLKQGRPGCLLVITAAHEGVDRKNAARLRRHAGYPESAHPKQMNRQTNYLYIWMLDSHLDARRHSIGSTRCRAAPCELSAYPSPLRSRQWARNLSCDRRRHASASSGDAVLASGVRRISSPSARSAGSTKTQRGTLRRRRGSLRSRTSAGERRRRAQEAGRGWPR